MHADSDSIDVHHSQTSNLGSQTVLLDVSENAKDLESIPQQHSQPSHVQENLHVPIQATDDQQRSRLIYTPSTVQRWL